MNDLIKKAENQLTEYLIGQESKLPLPQPFERDIYLFDTYVAGTTHVNGITEIEGNINEGDRLIFYREPENEYDTQAIRVETLKTEKIGYIPRQDNLIFSRLMDAEKLLFGKVISKELRGTWVRIKIKIFLHEN